MRTEDRSWNGRLGRAGTPKLQFTRWPCFFGQNARREAWFPTASSRIYLGVEMGTSALPVDRLRTAQISVIKWIICSPQFQLIS